MIDSAYPHFTLLGQSLGSLVVAHDAFSMLVPDIFIDTMGYAFTLALSKFLFPEVPTGAYVHYPTISTDMLGSLDAEPGKGLNAGAGKGWKGKLKRVYWQAFAWLYGWVGGEIDVVMTNSSWTQAHINSLWSAHRAKRQTPWPIEVVFPPVAVEELQQAIPLTDEKREPIILCIAQFRPEKNHVLVIRSFAKFMDLAATTTTAQEIQKTRLVLVGSVRNSEDATKVYDLRLLAHELKIKDQVDFICDASWPEILEWLRRSSVGVNGMWNEHFGIGVVEYQAAGLICVVNDSGGPFLDIVIDHDGGPTGTYFPPIPGSPFASPSKSSIQLTNRPLPHSPFLQGSTQTPSPRTPLNSSTPSPSRTTKPSRCVAARDLPPRGSEKKLSLSAGLYKWRDLLPLRRPFPHHHSKFHSPILNCVKPPSP